MGPLAWWVCEGFSFLMFQTLPLQLAWVVTVQGLMLGRIKTWLGKRGIFNWTDICTSSTVLGEGTIITSIDSDQILF